jgi:4-hydroxythreonine-4-phosphate dehydrogenase
MSGSKKNKPLVVLTPGDPAGVGPQVIVQSLRDSAIRNLADYLIVCDHAVLSAYKGFSCERWDYAGCRRTQDHCAIFLLEPGVISSPRDAILAKPTTLTARASFEYVRYASYILKKGLADCLVTGPVSKENIIKAGVSAWVGHTEFLARDCGVSFPVMLFSAPCGKAVVVTRHIALRDVSKKLTQEVVYKTIEAVHLALRKQFGMKRPRIAVAGLNPHCGEGGKIGDEERRLIVPALRRAQKRYGTVFGPYSTETILYDIYRGKYDCVIGMYHDQILGALKMVARDSLVNITIGLPYVRTSCAHGTAFDIARSRRANPESLKSAIKEAVRMFSYTKR